MSEVGEKKVYEYVIGEKTFVMKPLVLGQVKLVSNLLKDRFPDATTNMQDQLVVDIIDKIQDILPQAFAIILIEKDSPADKRPIELKNRNLEEIAEEFEFTLDLNKAVEVCNDFFECTPLISVFQTLMGLMQSQGIGAVPRVVEEITESKTESTGSTELSSTSQQETSSEEKTSSGDTP